MYALIGRTVNWCFVEERKRDERVWVGEGRRQRWTDGGRYVACICIVCCVCWKCFRTHEPRTPTDAHATLRTFTTSPAEDKGLKLKCLSEQTKPFCFFAFCLEKKRCTLNSPLFTFCIIKWSTQLIHLAFCLHYLLYTLYMFCSHCGCKLNMLTVNTRDSSGLH